MTTILGLVPARLAMFYPLLGLTAGYLLAKLLAVFRDLLGGGWAEAVLILTWLAWTATRPDWLTPARWLALLGVQSLEPAALAVPAMLGQMTVIALAWTSRSLESHPLDQIRSTQALGAIVSSLVITAAVFNILGAVPLGLAAITCLGFHWHWHERTGGATAASLSRAGGVTECLALAFSAWLF